MKNLVNDYYEDMDEFEDEDNFERFGRKGKLPPKENQRPRFGAQDVIKNKRRARELEREQMSKDASE